MKGSFFYCVVFSGFFKKQATFISKNKHFPVDNNEK